MIEIGSTPQKTEQLVIEISDTRGSSNKRSKKKHSYTVKLSVHRRSGQVDTYSHQIQGFDAIKLKE